MNDQELLEILIEKESALLDPKARQRPENLYGLIGPAFFEFGCSGRIWERDWQMVFHQGTQQSPGN